MAFIPVYPLFACSISSWYPPHLLAFATKLADFVGKKITVPAASVDCAEMRGRFDMIIPPNDQPGHIKWSQDAPHGRERA